MQQAYSLWLSYKDTLLGRSWIETTRSKELQRERRRNPWAYSPRGPLPLEPASDSYEMIHRPSRHLTRRIHGIEESTPRGTQLPRASKVSSKRALELQDERLEREAAKYGEASQPALTDETVMERCRSRKIKNIQKKEMRLWMEANFTESITDGLTVVHKYDAAGLGKNTKKC